MISYIEGRLVQKNPTHLVVDVGGVGYSINIPLSSYGYIGELGSPIKVLIYFHVREDDHQLYGFMTEEERELFKLLISVSGMGPKLAQSILSGVSVEEFKDAIARNDLSVLTSISGIGKKTAQRLIFELREKLRAIKVEEEKAPVPTISYESGVVKEAVLAMVSLGFKQDMARRVVGKVVEQSEGEPSVEDLIKRALRHA